MPKKKTLDEIRREISELRSAGAALSGVAQQLQVAVALTDRAAAAVRDRQRERALRVVADLEHVLAHAGAHATDAQIMLDEDAVCDCCRETALVDEIVAALAACDGGGPFTARLPEFIDAIRARAAATGADLRWMPADERAFRTLLFDAAAAADEEHAIAVTYHPAINVVDFRRRGSQAGEAPAA